MLYYIVQSNKRIVYTYPNVTWAPGVTLTLTESPMGPSRLLLIPGVKFYGHFCLKALASMGLPGFMNGSAV